MRELERISFFFVQTRDWTGTFPMNATFWNQRAYNLTLCCRGSEVSKQFLRRGGNVRAERILSGKWIDFGTRTKAQGIKDEYSAMLQSSLDSLKIFFTATTQKCFIRIGARTVPVFPRTVFPPARTDPDFFLPSWCLHEMNGIGLSIVAGGLLCRRRRKRLEGEERRQKWA